MIFNMDNNAEDALSQMFDWSGDEPGPDKVIQEAEQRGIEQLSNLTEYMNDAPSNCTTGYRKWKHHREYRDSFTDDS